MPFHCPRAAIVAAGSAIALFLTSCDTKTAQCDSLIDTINEGIELIEDFEAKSKTFEAATGEAKTPKAIAPIMSDFANELELFNEDLAGVADEVGSLELKDESLSGFQQQYSENLKQLNGLFGTLTQALRDMGTVLTSIANTPPNQITPDKAQKWTADAKKAEASLATVEADSDQATQAIDTIADDINTYCGREASAE